MGEQQQERRGNPRFVCELRTFVRTADGALHTGSSADLSRSGVSVTLDAPAPVGAEVSVHLRLVLGWTAADFLTLPGTVARCDDKVAGIAFGTLDDGSRQKLDLLMRVLEGELDAVLEAE